MGEKRNSSGTSSTVSGNRAKYALHMHSSTVREKSEQIGKILQRRSELGVTIEELCLEAEISISTFVRMAAGSHSPRPRTLRKLKRALDDLEEALD